MSTCICERRGYAYNGFSLTENNFVSMYCWHLTDSILYNVRVKAKGEDYVTQIIDYCMYRSIDVVDRL